MRACWMFMILLSCRLSHATKEKCTCNERKIVCVAAGDDVLVPCPNLTGEEVTYYLLKDDKVIYNHTCFREKHSNCKPRHTVLGVELRDSFMLTGVNVSSSGIYNCEVRVMYPPPFLKACSSCTQVQVEEHQCKLDKVTEKPETDDEKPETVGNQKSEFLWLWILALVLLGVYGVTVTIIAAVIWVKWRGADSQSDYMNTKPKASRDRKKKRGVQIPIPRHF
ncbi:cytotoxic T-lymphocyte protein 4 [Sebastes umbrosus]|uniref:cytotoxic T-lymphocyte protein 4 n=1 Tax=Sebastes umbrosus TaxID=72105 RepID=UPI0018A0F44A|nr:cytotoxic T-lymphocyte protein 4 [Sebastes umbrosus]